MNRSNLKYGCSSAVPEFTQTAWGAKAVWVRSPVNAFKIPEGQQDSFGPDAAKLKKWLNANIKEIRSAFSKACQTNRICLGGSQEILLFEDSDFKLVASPMGSHTSLHLAAWKKRSFRRR